MRSWELDNWRLWILSADLGLLVLQVWWKQGPHANTAPVLWTTPALQSPVQLSQFFCCLVCWKRSRRQEPNSVGPNRKAPFLEYNKLVGNNFLCSLKKISECDDICNLLLNKVNCLGLGTRLTPPMEQHLLGQICEIKLTSAYAHHSLLSTEFCFFFNQSHGTDCTTL